MYLYRSASCVTGKRHHGGEGCTFLCWVATDVYERRIRPYLASITRTGRGRVWIHTCSRGGLVINMGASSRRTSETSESPWDHPQRLKELPHQKQLH